MVSFRAGTLGGTSLIPRSKHWDGAKWTCGVPELSARTQPTPCIVYSIGSFGDDTFETRIQELSHTCEIHVFGPSLSLARMRCLRGTLVTTKRFHTCDAESSTPARLVRALSRCWLCLAAVAPSLCSILEGLWQSRFDPTISDPETKKRMEAKWNFHNVGLGNPDAPDKPNFAVKTLNTLMTELGHKYINILKVAAEGAAWDSFYDARPHHFLPHSGEVVPAGQHTLWERHQAPLWNMVSTIQLFITSVSYPAHSGVSELQARQCFGLFF